MIFVDSNIPMYLVGADHPNKVEARRLVERLVTDRVALVTDAEVYQEILHRYLAIGRLDAIGPACGLLDHLVDEVSPIDRQHVAAAHELLLGAPGFSARDALHVAVMRRLDCRRILTFDSAFDLVPGVERVGPSRLGPSDD